MPAYAPRRSSASGRWDLRLGWLELTFQNTIQELHGALASDQTMPSVSGHADSLPKPRSGRQQSGSGWR